MEELLKVSLVILCFQLSSVNSQQAETPRAQIIQEGENASVSCSYKSMNTNLQWYRQDSRGSLALLLLMRSNEREKYRGRLKATLDASTKTSSLFISAAQLVDAATYFCATDTGTNKYIFGAGTRLKVLMIIENPEPAVYQLRDPKSRNTSVCLFTDFDSNVNLSESVLPGVPHTQPTVLNMKSLDSKSNAAVAWSSKSNFDCRNTFGDPTFYPSSDYPCNATLVEESFETDMNLNLENLSVMALRILLLKVAGFNLLMTLRLWSS